MIDESIRIIYPIGGKDDENKPVIVIVHGGGWMTGSTESMSDVYDSLTQKTGFTCVTITYKLSSIDSMFLQKLLALSICCVSVLLLLSPCFVQRVVLMIILIFVCVFIVTHLIVIEDNDMNRHPVHVVDLCRTLSLIHKNFGNNRQIVLLGHSAGAHLVSLIVTNTRFILAEPNGYQILDRIIGVVAISGPYSAERLNNSLLARHLMSCVFSDKRDDVVDAFPLYHVHENLCPFLLINSGGDMSLLLHAFDFYHALRAKNILVKTLFLPNTCHITVKKNWKTTNKLARLTTVNFIHSLIK
jgi:acetyl esterase/lipase